MKRVIDGESLFRASGYPVLQNKVFSSQTDALNFQTGEIDLRVDQLSGIVTNFNFDASLLSYDEQYQNEQGLSGEFNKHLDKVERILYPHFHGKSVLEIGCGKGLFLEKLRALGYDINGIDPTYEGEDPSIKKVFYNDQIEKYDCIILRHVMEHIQDPVTFLNEIKRVNNGGIVYIEVPCFDWILDNSTWYDIFYEHVNYFTKKNFRDMFGTVLDIGNVFGGQYLYVLADLYSLRVPGPNLGSRKFDNLLVGIEKMANQLTNKRYAVWGGSSKGVIFSLVMKQKGCSPLTAVDINPVKQGRFMPVSGVNIISPSELKNYLHPGETLVIMNRNYSAEIIAATENIYDYVLL